MCRLSAKRKIAVVTGTRADYGLLYWLMKEIDQDSDLELMVLVTGTHLCPEFGSTWKVIARDGFHMAARVEMLLSSDTPVGIAKSTGIATMGFAETFERLKPDLVVVLGDRFEILSAATAAHIARIPLAHIHGGETTEGAMDEAFRHAITKMSQLHFVAAEPYRKRVIQMGEFPERVFLVGALGLDHLHHTDYLERGELAATLGIGLERPFFLVTYHPVTLQGSPKEAVKALVEVLEQFVLQGSVVWTYPNGDTQGREIIVLVQGFAQKYPDRVCAVPSLGQRRYLSALNLCDLVIGNSSSGLTEAPSFGVPTVNLGKRQEGRLRASSVIDCGETSEEIARAVTKALSPEFREKARGTSNPYGSPGASGRIKDVLKNVSLSDVMAKKFYDLP